MFFVTRKKPLPSGANSGRTPELGSTAKSSRAPGGVDLAGSHQPAFEWRFLLPMYWPVWLALFALRLGLYAPRRLWNACGWFLGEAYYRASRKRRCVARANIAICFPALDPVARERLVRTHFHEAMQCMCDLGVLWWAPRERVERFVRLQGIAHLDAITARGQAAIILTAHAVALEMGSVLSLHHAYAALVKPLRNRLMNYFFARGRARFGAVLFARNSGLRPLLRALDRGIVLYFLPDEDLGVRDSVFVPFFGEPAATLTSLGRIAAHVQAAVLPVYTRRRADGHGYDVVIEPPLADFPSGDPEHDATRMNAVLEAGVRAAPSQYLWTFKRFKNRPPGAASVYDEC